LIDASIRGHADVCELLLKRGADIDFADIYVCDMIIIFSFAYLYTDL